MTEQVGPPPAPETRVEVADSVPRPCPRCGVNFPDASALTDHVLTAHAGVDSPATYLRPVRHHTFLRVLAVLACLVPVALIGLGLSGVFDKESAEETPSSVVHQMAVELKSDGAIDDYRAVEPDEGWDTEYELDGDVLLRIRNEATPAEELEYEGFDQDVADAVEDEAQRRGFLID